MPELIIEENLRAEDIKNVLLLDPAREEQFVHFDSVVLERGHHSFVSRRISRGDNGDTNRFVGIVHSFRMISLDLLNR